jgi:putative ABC transport system permease protein
MSRLLSARLRKSFADVTRRKGRTLLVVLGIFIGVVGLTAINTAEDALFAAITFSVGSQATRPDIVANVDHLDPALLPTLQAVADVQTVQYQTVLNTQWHVRQAPGHINMVITSYPDLRHVPLSPFQLTSGRYPSVGEIVMEYGDLGLQPFTLGATVTVDTSQGTARLRVVGLARTSGHNPASSGTGEGYMSDAGLRQITAGASTGLTPTSVSLDPEIAIKVQRRATTVAATVQQLLSAHGVTIYNLSVQEHSPPRTSAIAGVFSLLRILIIVAVVMSGFLILNTVTTLVAEQTAIIGTMKAVGGTRGAIMRGYLVSVGIYSALATLPAIALGVFGGYQLGAQLATTVPIDLGPFVLQWWIVIVGLAAGFGVPLVAALVPLWNGTHISVRDALAAYGVSAASGNGVMARLGQRLTWISQTAWLGLRGVFRKRWRAALTLLTLTLAGVSFLIVQTASTSVASTVRAVNANIAADIEIGSEPLSLTQLRAQLSAVGNIRRVERFWHDRSVETQWGQMQVMAFDPDTQLYHYHLTGGRWLATGEADTVLLSDEALARSGLRIGDSLTISEQGNRATVRIIGTVKQPIDHFGGIGAIIMSLDSYNQFTGVSAGSSGDVGDVAQAFLVQAQDRSSGAVNHLAEDVDRLLNQGATQNCPQVCSGGRFGVALLSVETAQQLQNWIVLYALLYAVALVVGMAGALALANALTASVLERRREIGMLRAMGASGWRIGQVSWSEGLALGGISWLAGGIIGLPLAYLFVRAFGQLVMPLDFVIDPAAFVVMLGAIGVIATLATIAPSLRAAQIRIADMLRYE